MVKEKIKSVQLDLLLNKKLCFLLKSSRLKDFGLFEAACNIVSIAIQMAEEGRSLFPRIYVCSDFDTTKKMLQLGKAHKIVEGPNNVETISKGIKQCASICYGSWEVYFQIFHNYIICGLVQEAISPFSIDDLGSQLSAENEYSPLVYVLSRTSKSGIHFFSSHDGYIDIQISGNNSPSLELYSELGKFISHCVKKIEIDKRQKAKAYLENSLAKALSLCHGALLVCGNPTKRAMKVFQDSILLDTPIGFVDLFSNDALEVNSFASLLCHRSLLAGMINFDGIVYFSNAGQIIGYNIFLASKNVAKARSSNGGARRRAFLQLIELVKKSIFDSTLFRSSDGGIDYYEK